MESDRRDVQIRAAWLYHERQLNQQEVAERLGVSRSTVSRLLSAASAEGIVRVVLTEALPEATRLADELHELYGIRARVEPSIDGIAPLESAAIAMARRLESMAAAGPITIAAGWGRTLHRAAQAVRPTRTHGVHLVDAFGHTTTESMSATVEVTNQLATKFGTSVTHMPAPGFAESAMVARSFYESTMVSDALERARRADAVILSIGVTGESSLLLGSGYLDDAEMARVTGAGAVGEVFGIYFDADGRPLDDQPLCPISLSLADLQRAPRVLAAAGGAHKRDAVRAAIRAGVISELATDSELAEALLDG